MNCRDKKINPKELEVTKYKERYNGMQLYTHLQHTININHACIPGCRNRASIHSGMYYLLIGRRFNVAGPRLRDRYLLCFWSSLGTSRGSARLLRDHVIQRGHRDRIYAVRMGVWVRVDNPYIKVRNMT